MAGKMLFWQFRKIWMISGFPGGPDSKESARNAGVLNLAPGPGRSPGKEMATHFSTLAWKIPQTEEPGGLQSTGSPRDRVATLSFFQWMISENKFKRKT